MSYKNSEEMENIVRTLFYSYCDGVFTMDEIYSMAYSNFDISINKTSWVKLILACDLFNRLELMNKGIEVLKKSK